MERVAPAPGPCGALTCGVRGGPAAAAAGSERCASASLSAPSAPRAAWPSRSAASQPCSTSTACEEDGEPRTRQHAILLLSAAYAHSGPPHERPTWTGMCALGRTLVGSCGPPRACGGRCASPAT